MEITVGVMKKKIIIDLFILTSVLKSFNILIFFIDMRNMLIFSNWYLIFIFK